MKTLMILISVIFLAEVSYYVFTWIAAPEDEASGESVEQSPYCPGCHVVDPLLSDSGLCCGMKPILIEVSVRTEYLCDECGQSVSRPECCPGAVLTRTLKKSPLSALPKEAPGRLADKE